MPVVSETGRSQSEPTQASDATQNLQSKAVQLAGTRFWLLEVWEDHRESFKVLFGHACLLIFCVIVLEVLGYVIDFARLPETPKRALHVIDYLLIFFAIVIMGVGFIIKFVIVVWRDMKK